MSLQTRLAALITLIGADIKARALKATTFAGYGITGAQTLDSQLTVEPATGQGLLIAAGNGEFNYSGLILYNKAYTRYWSFMHRSGGASDEGSFKAEYWNGTTYNTFFEITKLGVMKVGPSLSTVIHTGNLGTGLSWDGAALNAVASPTPAATLTTAQTLAWNGDYQATQAANHTLPTAASGDVGKTIFVTSYADGVVLLRGTNTINDIGAGNDLGLDNGDSVTLMVRSAGVLEVVNQGTRGAPGGQAKTAIVLASNFSSISSVPAAVTGWTFYAVAGKKYRIQVLGAYQSAATTTGGVIKLLATNGAAGTFAGQAWGAITTAAAATELGIAITAIGSTLTTTGVSAINSPHYIGMDVGFACTTSGDISVGWATEVAASASQLNAGSMLIIEELP
ncbi:MAG TPA: hypothetical protein VF680_17445 [Allosphingosinicella sp.]|jgi:hypothetical protein